MQQINIIFIIIVIFIFSVTYLTFKQTKYLASNNKTKFDVLKDHLLNNSSLSNKKKPILWIHVDFEKNARKWVNFSEKNTNNLNKPYLYLSTKSIIDSCSDSFQVVIIDNSTFTKLIPGWDIDFEKLSDPLKRNYIHLAKLKLLYNYGGLCVPISFFCKHDLYELYYDNCIYQGDILCGLDKDDKPLIDFIGSKKLNDNLHNIIKDTQLLLSNDYTDEMWFENKLSKVFKHHKKSITFLDPKIIGTKDMHNKPLLLDDLFSNKKLSLCSYSNFGLYIPDQELTSRNKFNWFIYLNPFEVLDTQTAVNHFIHQYIYNKQLYS